MPEPTKRQKIFWSLEPRNLKLQEKNLHEFFLLYIYKYFKVHTTHGFQILEWWMGEIGPEF